MKTEELKQWRLDLMIQRKKELDAIHAKYERKLGALDVLLEDEDESTKKSAKAESPSANPHKSANKLSATREAIAQSRDRFTTAKLFAYVSGKYPGMVQKSSDLSNSVWVLKKGEEIEIVKKGAGPDSPPEYRATQKFRSDTGNGAQ